MIWNHAEAWQQVITPNIDDFFSMEPWKTVKNSVKFQAIYIFCPIKSNLKYRLRNNQIVGKETVLVHQTLRIGHKQAIITYYLDNHSHIYFAIFSVYTPHFQCQVISAADPKYKYNQYQS